MAPFTTACRSILAATICVTAATPLAAQPWPTRTLRIVTATPAGGSPDFVSRLLADKLTDRLGQARAAVAKSLPYDPIKDFAFVTLVSGYPMVVATAPNSPIKSFGDLIDRARAAPDAVT